MSAVHGAESQLCSDQKQETFVRSRAEHDAHMINITPPLPAIHTPTHTFLKTSKDLSLVL